MKPLVGVSAYTPPGYDDKAYAIPREYVEALDAAGADVVILPGGDATALLTRLDGLVLAGGGDLDAECYGACRHPTSYMVDGERDLFEIVLARDALAGGVPLLAICRGLQIVNVARGGTLVAHLPECYGDQVQHRLPPREPVSHSVCVVADSRLSRIIGEGSLDVMSWHHQAVERLGEGLRVVAHAADGVVEAIEATVPGWMAAVQWHPELNAATSPAQARLFSSLSEAAYRYRESRR